MAGNTSQSKSTKNLIIEAAFSFYKEPRYTDFSLSELAAKVGISKPAIYRHFTNKDAVINAMSDHFIDLLAEHLAEFDGTDSKREANIPFSKIIQFFVDNPQYINYFIVQFSCHSDYEKFLTEELFRRGIVSKAVKEKSFCVADDKNISASMFFCAITFLFFIKIREMICREQNIALDGNFANKIVKFVCGGLKSCSKPGDLLFPTPIAPERKAFFDELCKINVDDFPKEDRIFSALANVIKKYTMSGVTVERIASELNMAKSSLYFYFDNKNELIQSQILKELAVLEECCRENTVEARDFSEHMYITMRTELEYFFARPSIIPICGWLLQSTTGNPFGENREINNVWEKRLPRPIESIDLGFPIMPETLSMWFGMLPVALIGIGEKHSLGKETLFNALDSVFDYIQNGVEIR